MVGKFGVQLVCVGKMRETYFRDAEAEYKKRLTAHTTRLVVMEVADEATPDNASPAQEEIIRAKEAERILAAIGVREYMIALDGRGKTLDSPGLAALIERVMAEDGVSAFCFVIGGSLGLHESVRERADLLLSFGAFTFPHQLMRVILLEQLFRAGKIRRGEAYHK